MYFKLFFFLLFACISSGLLTSCNTTSTSNDPKGLKVMSWNIWHGGHSKHLPSYGCQGTLGILKQSDADVILMVETYGASAGIADYLGYYHRLLSNNLSVYSRYPITDTYTFSDSISTSNFGGVEIDMNGQKVRLFDTWLHYLPDCRTVPSNKSEQEILEWDDAGSRDDEIRKILNVLKPFIAESDSIPIIMGGDFNIHSHLDWTEATKNRYNHGGAVVNWTVSKEMENAGFKDSFREINPDPVKNIGRTWMHPVNEDWEFKRSALERTGKYMPYDESEILRYDRIDFIYYQGELLKAIESEIYNNDIGELFSLYGEEFLFASDHGFVLTSFEIK